MFYTRESYHTCSARLPDSNTRLEPELEKIKNLKPCFDAQCDTRKNETLVLQLNWFICLYLIVVISYTNMRLTRWIWWTWTHLKFRWANMHFFAFKNPITIQRNKGYFHEEKKSFLPFHIRFLVLYALSKCVVFIYFKQTWTNKYK